MSTSLTTKASMPKRKVTKNIRVRRRVPTLSSMMCANDCKKCLQAANAWKSKSSWSNSRSKRRLSSRKKSSHHPLSLSQMRLLSGITSIRAILRAEIWKIINTPRSSRHSMLANSISSRCSRCNNSNCSSNNSKQQHTISETVNKLCQVRLQETWI